MASPYEFATARGICINALVEIGAYDVGEDPSADDIQIALARLQMLLQAWQAEKLTIGINTRTTFTLSSGVNTRTIGPTGNIVTTTRPYDFTAVNYVIPGSSPAVETPMGRMDDDSYANLSVKSLSSALPTAWYYNETVPDGTLFFWPTVNQNVTIALYILQPYLSGLEILTDNLVGPQGWSEAMMYQLALRLLTPFRINVADVPLIPKLAIEAFDRIQRPNNMPGLLGVDQALVPTNGYGYNIYNNSYSAPSSSR